jgi:dTDP-glucose pyrophosphorylase
VKQIDNIKISMSSTINDALRVIDIGRMQIALIVDEKDILLGTLTDGDIRRALLNGLDLNSPIENIIFKKPTVAQEKDSKEKILNLALSKNLRQIPIVDNNNKILGIYEIEEFIKPKKKLNKVVLMVGGIGERLRPLTENTPKPMLQVGNRPILHTIVEKFSNCGFVDIVMCVNYKSKIIQDYFGDGKKFGVNIEYVQEDQKMGTAGALSLLKDKLNEPFFVMNGDLLTTLDFEKMLDFHLDNKSKATMCVRQYKFKIPFGVVSLNNENIVSLEEKPIHNFFVNAGIYVLDSECLEFIPNKFYNMTSLFEKMVSNRKKTISFPMNEYWIDIGRLVDYEKANSEYHSIFNEIK